MSDPKSSERDEARRVEEVASAWRPRDPDTLVFHPAWHDIDAPGRLRAFDVATRARKVEAALDPLGLSTTARAVLARIRGGG